MDSLTKQTALLERQNRKQVLQYFREARQQFIEGYLAGNGQTPTFMAKIWWWVYIPPIFQVPIWFHTETIIDVPLLRTMPHVRLATDGRLVHPPSTYRAFWQKDRMRVASYSNEELFEMIAVFNDQYPQL